MNHIRLALFDPCDESDEPVDLVGPPIPDLRRNRLLFSAVIARFNKEPDTQLVLAVIEAEHAET